MTTSLLIGVRTLGRERERYVVCGQEKELIRGGNHPRGAAADLAERIAAGRPYSLRECNPWQYDLEITGELPAIPPQDCTHAPASPVQNPEVSHP